jgi:hypothetical protein
MAAQVSRCSSAGGDAVDNVAIVRDSDGLVKTILRGDASPVIPDGFHAVAESQLPEGWSRIAPEADTPAFVTRWQIRQAMLRRYQITPANVESFITATITDSVDQASALIDWRDSPIVRRDHALIGPFVAYLSSLLETTVDADEFFRYADTLER